MDIVTTYKGIEYNHANYTTATKRKALPDEVRQIIEKSEKETKAKK
jgi:hypothetical protein